MNDRRNLQYAIKLDEEMTSIEGEKKHLDMIKKEKIDLLCFGSGDNMHTIYWTDIEKLGLEVEIQRIVEFIQNNREKLLAEKENKFKEL